jgi:hypothetical protein
MSEPVASGWLGGYAYWAWFRALWLDGYVGGPRLLGDVGAGGCDGWLGGYVRGPGYRDGVAGGADYVCWAGLPGGWGSWLVDMGAGAKWPWAVAVAVAGGYSRAGLGGIGDDWSCCESVSEQHRGVW